MQDQSAIAQDIATLYAAIPDHTAVRGVSSKGRAQFTDFKYEKAEVRPSLVLYSVSHKPAVYSYHRIHCILYDSVLYYVTEYTVYLTSFWCMFPRA